MKNNNNITPTNLYNDKYSSLIRSIKIHLPHREYKEEDDEHKYDEFVGRDRQMECLYNWLSDRKNESGSYLVTGFRGMGKTKLVERVTDRLTREVKEQQEPWWRLIVLLPVLVSGVFFASKQTLNGSWGIVIGVLCVWMTLISLLYLHNLHYFDRKKKRDRRKYPNHNLFSDEQVSRMARGKVVVRIWVDRKGNVTRVEAPYQGSTITRAVSLSKLKPLHSRLALMLLPMPQKNRRDQLHMCFKI